MRKDDWCNKYSAHSADSGKIISEIKEEQATGDTSSKINNIYTRKIFNCPTCNRTIYMEYRPDYVNSCCGVKYKGTSKKSMG
ncbi:TPA: hypothetical protein ACVTHL_005476 [Bacillus cereus]|uniref:hypothetical protein n=1 Tax=Bacillus cereus TaxID=1396 RepID=UPI0007AB413F|nr:hypothetical protein [Bacillus cereus]KZD72328.1 hypothetical protein B4120_4759 [Bacillus cereus]